MEQDMRRQRLIENQFKLPNTDSMRLLAHKYPLVRWEEAMELYAMSVQEVLIYFHTDSLFDAPLSFGRGLAYTRRIFETKLQNLSQIRGGSYHE